MFEPMMSPDQPNQLYAELVQLREQKRLARRVTRQRAVVRPEAETSCPVVR